MALLIRLEPRGGALDVGKALMNNVGNHGREAKQPFSLLGSKSSSLSPSPKS